MHTWETGSPDSLAHLHTLPTHRLAGLQTDEIQQELAALVKTSAQRWHGDEAHRRRLLLQASVIIMFSPSSATRPQISETQSEHKCMPNSRTFCLVYVTTINSLKWWTHTSCSFTIPKSIVTSTSRSPLTGMKVQSSGSSKMQSLEENLGNKSHHYTLMFLVSHKYTGVKSKQRGNN